MLLVIGAIRWRRVLALVLDDIIRNEIRRTIILNRQPVWIKKSVAFTLSKRLLDAQDKNQLVEIEWIWIIIEILLSKIELISYIHKFTDSVIMASNSWYHIIHQSMRANVVRISCDYFWFDWITSYIFFLLLISFALQKVNIVIDMRHLYIYTKAFNNICLRQLTFIKCGK